MKQLTILIALTTSLFFVACNDDSASTENIQVSFSNLPDLGVDYVYEGWLAVNGGVESAGRFTVDASGSPSQNVFDFPGSTVSNSSAYILTIEPANETGADLAAPSSTHILAGDFSGSSALLTMADARALGTNFGSAAGGYILATPTTASTTDEDSGVWFLDPTAGPGPALTLPTLPAGWVYEGWAVIGGTPYSTGTFTSVMGADNSSMFSGPNPGPPFPGEDFITGRSIFPTTLAGGTIVVSVEPFPDNDAAPFALKPLVGQVPAAATVHSLYNLGQNNADQPSGTITR